MIFQNKKRKVKFKKGFFFTLDAIFALLILLSLFGFGFYYLENKNNDFDDYAQIVFFQDVLDVVIETNILDNLILTTDSTQLSLFLNKVIPRQFCSTIKIYSTAPNVLLYSISKNDCSTSTSSILRRMFYFEDEIYYAEVLWW